MTDVEQAQRIARASGRTYGLVLADEVDRLEAERDDWRLATEARRHEVERLAGDLEHADVEREAWRKHAERLEAQLDSVRAELAATAAHIAAWDEALDACLPALHDQMQPRRVDIPNVQTVAARIPMSAQLAAELGLPWEPDA